MCLFLDYGKFNKVEFGKIDNLSRAERFLTLLGTALVDNDFQIYTGFGAGVGNYILSGVLKSRKKNPLNVDITNSEIHINSLMGVEDGLKDKITRRMIGQCSSMIVLFGYGENREKSGIFREYEIARENGNYIIPVRNTGFAAQIIYDELEVEKQLPEGLEFLKTEEDIKEMVEGIVHNLNVHRREKEEKLNEQLFSSVAMYGIGIFISYHYDSDNHIAREITEIINTDKINVFSVVRENEKQKDDEIIKNWVDEEIKKTRITILLISEKTFDRKYVSYELSKSLLNGNTVIPILIDSEENAFNEDGINLVNKKLDKELSGKKLKIRKWFQENGKENILRWLNEALEKEES